ncbi:hypothetical protein [Burkholderia ambifaria]|uniref:hypothetical protein n=1 Tax=Burkholderia ambifaria TaxID=152480 RepID=UPI002FE3B52B
MSTQQIELGWMNIVPCARVRMVTVEGPGGIKIDVPRAETAEQRLYAYADIDSPNWSDAANSAAKECIGPAIAAAGGVGAITANPAAAAAAFGAAFLREFYTKMGEVAINSIHLETSSKCMW